MGRQNLHSPEMRNSSIGKTAYILKEACTYLCVFSWCGVCDNAISLNGDEKSEKSEKIVNTNIGYSCCRHTAVGIRRNFLAPTFGEENSYVHY